MWALRTSYYVIVCLVSLEVIARVDDWARWRAPILAAYSIDQLRVQQAGGPVNRPNARFQQFRINSHGFRGEEFQLRKPVGTRRVAVVGASEALGLYESDGKDLSSQLQALLNAKAPGRYQVINAAAPGLSPPRLRAFYHQWLKRFDIDILVFYPTPSFYLDTSPPLEVRPESPTIDAPSHPSGTFSFAPRLPGKAWTAIRREMPASWQTQLKEAQIDRERRLYPDAPWREVPPDRLLLFKRHIEEFVSDVTADRIQLLLVTHAIRLRGDWRSVDRDVMIGWIRFFPRASGECLREMESRANAFIREFGMRHAIPVADVAVSVAGTPENFADFAHFTDAGANAAAQTIGNALLSYATGSTSPPAEVTR
jgi:hypothetical protein